MPTTFMILMILVLGLFLISRRILESGNQYLDTEQKAGLVDLFMPLRKKSPAIILVLLVAFFANLYLKIIPDGIALSVYFFILTFMMLYLAYLSYKLLEENNYPKPYIKAYLQSSLLRMTGLVVLIVAFTTM